MSLAKLIAEQSYCTRKKVGAIIVTETGGTYLGFNGMPSGMPNICEVDNKTNPFVIHAEENCLSKMLKEGVSSKNAKVYVTLSPCIECAKMLYSAGIKEVYYKEKYHDCSHIKVFEEYGMNFIQLKD